uniref:(northern house mosquito) hypothetical protein n=1 Tax=Culex pipiens TaxID=7175 RepID=A0A8D7ZWC9_CULPI
MARMSSRRTMVPERKRTNAEGIDTAQNRSPGSAATNRAREQVCTTRPDRSPVSGPARNQFSTGKNVTKGPDRHQDGVSRTNAERIHTAQNRSPVSAGTDAGKTIASGRNR